MFLFSRTPRTARLLIPALVVGAASLSHAQTPVSPSVAAANKTELVFRVQEFHGNDIWPSKLVSTFNFKLSAPAWKAMLGEEGVKTTASVARDVGSWIKEQGIGDFEQVETSNNNDRKSTQGEVDELLAEGKKKIGFSLEATQAKLSPGQSRTLINYVSYVGQFLNRADWTPRGGRANIRLIVSSTAKDVAVTANKDATNFTVVMPLKEAIDWGGKMEKGLKRFGK